MLHLRFRLTGTDAVLIAKMVTCWNILKGMDLLKIRPPGLATDEQVESALNLWQHLYDNCKFGDRRGMLDRANARGAAIEIFKRLLMYVQSVANEAHIALLIEAGFEVMKAASRKKGQAPVVAPAAD